MIEHSPSGRAEHSIVPGFPETPLCLAQGLRRRGPQGRHVTARSLAARQNFHAANLDALIAGTIGPEALETNFSIFDRYVGSLPLDRRARAEGFRTKVPAGPSCTGPNMRQREASHRPRSHAHPFPRSRDRPASGASRQLPVWLRDGGGAGSAPASWAIQIHDNDDGAAVFNAPGMEAALSKLQEVLDSAPFNMNELGALISG